MSLRAVRLMNVKNSVHNSDHQILEMSICLDRRTISIGLIDIRRQMQAQKMALFIRKGSKTPLTKVI
jgi:hypothetical protein